MCVDKDPPPCEHDDLIVEVDRLQGHNASLTATVKELRRQLAAAQRSGKRQAAPFSKGGRTDKPRRPGRKPGMGNFSYRKLPLQMSCRGRQWMCRWTTTTVPDVEECSSRREWMLPT